MSNRLKLNNRERIAVNVMKSIFSDKFIDNYLAEYGKRGLYHHIMAHLPSGHVRLGIDPKYNLILSKIKMRAKSRKAIKSINRLLFSIGDLYPTSNNDNSYKVYVVLTKLSDSKPTREGYLDKRNGQPVKPELTAIHRKFIRQVTRSNGKLAITDFENPVKTSKYHHIYSEPHNHNILIAKQSQRYQLQRQLKQDFNKVTSYKPVKATIRPITYHHKQPDSMDELLKAVDSTIIYFMTDDDIQTKDCDPELFKDDEHSKLSHNQKQLAFRSQLQTYKGTSSTTYSHVRYNDFNQSITRQQAKPSNREQISDLKAQLKLAKITEKHQTGKPKQHTKHLITRLTDQITTNSTTKATNHNLLDQLKRLPEWDAVDMLCGYRFARYWWTGVKAMYRLNVAKMLYKPLPEKPLLIRRYSKKDATPSVIIGTASGIPP